MTARRPDNQSPSGLTRERILGAAGLAGLLAVAVAILLMVAASGGDDDLTVVPGATPTPESSPSQTSTPDPTPTPVPLTAEQRAQRDTAVDLLASRGFKPVKLRTYRGDHTLRVLIGKPEDGGDGGRIAFFFVEGRYVGNDDDSTSYRLSVGRQSDLKTTLRYGVFAPGDEACCPSETRSVSFEWDGQRLQPLDLVPDPASRAAPAQ